MLRQPRLRPHVCRSQWTMLCPGQGLMRTLTWPKVLAEQACVTAEAVAKPMSATNEVEAGLLPDQDLHCGSRGKRNHDSDDKQQKKAPG